MLRPNPTHRFKKALKKFEHNKSVKRELDAVLGFLLKKAKLPEKYLDHALTGECVGFREHHIKPDTLLIYWLKDDTNFVKRVTHVPFPPLDDGAHVYLPAATADAMLL